jgi:hypothetical protein
MPVMDNRPAMSEATRRLAGFEMLLRRMHICQTPPQVVELLAHALPGLADTDWAELHLLDAGAACAEEHRDLAVACIGAGCVCAVGGGGHPSMVAVPLLAASAAIVLGRSDGERFHPMELKLLRLFADHASSSLMRFALPVSA